MENNNNILIRNAGVILAVVFSILSLIGLVNIKDMDTISLITILLAVPLRCIYLYRFNDISKNFARIWLWISWDLPLVVMQSLLFSMYIQTIHEGAGLLITAADVNFTISIGGIALLIHFICSIGFKNEHFGEVESVPAMSWGMFLTLAGISGLVILASMIFAKFYGLGILSQANIYLPYKLTGIINYINNYILLFYALFFFDGVIKNRKNIFIAIIPIAFLTLLYTYISLSKAIPISVTVILATYLIISGRMKMLYMWGIGIILLLAFILGSFITSYRDSLSTIRSLYLSEMTAEYGALQYVHRIFPEGVYLQKFHAYFQTVDKGEELKFYKYNITELHTRGIDKSPEISMHSSGNSTLSAAYCFGYGVMIPLIALMSLGTVLIDYKFPKFHNALGTSFSRSYLVFFFVFLVCNQFLFTMLASLLNPETIFASFLLPASIPVICILYVMLFCRLFPNQEQ